MGYNIKEMVMGCMFFLFFTSCLYSVNGHSKVRCCIHPWIGNVPNRGKIH